MLRFLFTMSNRRDLRAARCDGRTMAHEDNIAGKPWTREKEIEAMAFVGSLTDTERLIGYRMQANKDSEAPRS